MIRVQSLQENSLPDLEVKLFNCLPAETRGHNGSLDTYMKKVDKFLSSLPDKPPLPHYYQNSATNSILKQGEQMQLEKSRKR